MNNEEKQPEIQATSNYNLIPGIELHAGDLGIAVSGASVGECAGWLYFFLTRMKKNDVGQFSFKPKRSDELLFEKGSELKR